jgi:hypothetical protein
MGGGRARGDRRSNERDHDECLVAGDVVKRAKEEDNRQRACRSTLRASAGRKGLVTKYVSTTSR